MKRICVALAFLALAGSGEAACFADYKAKKDNPLRLHYGVIELTGDACGEAAARQEIARRIAGEGWTLLSVGSIFDESGLAARREEAGDYFLRF